MEGFHRIRLKVYSPLCIFLATGVCQTGIWTLGTAQMLVLQPRMEYHSQAVTSFDTLRLMASVYGKMSVVGVAGGIRTPSPSFEEARL